MILILDENGYKVGTRSANVNIWKKEFLRLIKEMF